MFENMLKGFIYSLPIPICVGVYLFFRFTNNFAYYRGAVFGPMSVAILFISLFLISFIISAGIGIIIGGIIGQRNQKK